jgi:hypothetical protein
MSELGNFEERHDDIEKGSHSESHARPVVHVDRSVDEGGDAHLRARVISIASTGGECM